MRVLIEGIKGKKSIEKLLDIIHKIPESEKSVFMQKNEDGMGFHRPFFD